MINVNKPTLFDLFSKEITNRDSVLELSKEIQIFKNGNSIFKFNIGLDKETFKLSCGEQDNKYLNIYISIKKSTKLGEFIYLNFTRANNRYYSLLLDHNDNINYQEFTDLLQKKLLFELNKLSKEMLIQNEKNINIIDFGVFSNEIKLKCLKRGTLPEYYFEDVVGLVRDDLNLYLSGKEISFEYFFDLTDSIFIDSLCLTSDEINKLDSKYVMPYYSILKSICTTTNKEIPEFQNIFSIIFDYILNKDIKDFKILNSSFKTVESFLNENTSLITDDVYLYVTSKYQIENYKNLKNIIINNYEVFIDFNSYLNNNILKFQNIYCTKDILNFINNLLHSFSELNKNTPELEYLTELSNKITIIDLNDNKDLNYAMLTF